MHIKSKGLLLLLTAALLFCCAGCESSSKQSQPYLILVGDLSATRQDFKRFWESYLAPIHANGDIDALTMEAGLKQTRKKILEDPFLIIKLLKAKADIRAFVVDAGVRQIKMDALDQFVITMLLEARAEDLGIVVTNEELETEVAKVREDYTEDVFKETLLKAAMHYELWREGLRRRLLMERVMRADLYAYGEITPEDVERFGGLQNGKTKASAEEVLERVYRAKAENDFQRWIEELRRWYPVNINLNEWAAVLSE